MAKDYYKILGIEKNASADDVKSLIKLVKSQVKKKFGIVLEEEVIYV